LLLVAPKRTLGKSWLRTLLQTSMPIPPLKSKTATVSASLKGVLLAVSSMATRKAAPAPSAETSMWGID
jgi:hypothetical protein